MARPPLRRTRRSSQHGKDECPCLLAAQELHQRPQSCPKAVPTVFALMVKTDKNNCPVRAKSRIVVLGNLKDGEWTHPECYAPA
jgi:hypothetical protein